MAKTSAGPQASLAPLQAVPAPEGFFLRQGSGQRLCVLHDCVAPARASAVFVHGFAEEMNKSRRMVSLQARALASAGCAVMLIDLAGCGDSSGSLADVQWVDWLADVRLAADWMRQRHPHAPCWLWGLRAGCLVASEVAAHSVPGHPVLHWQPLASGKTLAQQLLRLKAAAHLADPAAAKRASAEVRAALSNGAIVEIAGYPIPAGLFHSMQASVLLPPPAGQAVRCIEVSPRTEAELLPATAKLMQAWAGDGLDVQSQVVAGPSFWQTQEIEVAPALLSATISALGLHPPTADLPA